MFRPLLFTALVAVGGVAHAGDVPLYAPAPAWVKPVPAVAKTVSGEEAPIITVYDQQQRIQDGKLWAYTETGTRIASGDVLTAAGTIQLQWQPSEGDLTVHRVAILRDGREIDLLANPARFTVLRRESQLERLEMNGILTATMAAEGLRIGDELRIAYSVTTLDPALKGGVQSIVLLPTLPVRVGFGRALLSWKAGTALAYRTYLPGVTVQPHDAGGYREIEIALPLAKPADLPNDAPLRVRGMPVLDASSFADWAAVSSVMAPLYRTDGLIAAGSPLTGEVAKIAAASSDPRVRAAAALQLVQGVRYLFQGMNGGNYTPQTPAQTWALRYGDCKAKTLLLLALLHGLGIEAEAVTAHSQLGDVLPTRLPMPAAFDHVLVRATIAGKSLWLDGTGQGARLADLDDTPPFGWVLPLREGGATLLAVPRMPAARPDMAVTIDIDQRAGLGMPAPYTATMTMRGAMASQAATAAGQLPPKERRDMLLGAMNQAIGESQPIDLAVTQDATLGTTTIKASGIMMSGWALDDRRYSRTLDKVVSGLDFSPDRTRPAWRDIPVVLNAGGGFQYEATIQLPLERTGFTLDGDTTLSETLAGSRIRRTTTLNDGVVRLVERADAAGGEIAPTEIGAVRKRLALAQTRLVRVMAPADYPARWQVVQAARAAGRFKPLEAAYARAIAAAPKDVLGYQNRAAFRTGIFDWRGAIADLDRMIAIEPTIDAYVRRSSLYDMLGDYPRALADAETAYGLDSAQTMTVGRLTEAQSQVGQTDKALALLDERIDAGGQDKADYLQMKSDVLVRARRGDEAVAAMDLAVKDKPGSAAMLNGRCWAKAQAKVQLDTALKDCTKSIELGDAAAAAFDSRALVYFQMGRMDEALADADAALDISPGLPATMFVRGAIKRRKGDIAGGDADLAAARMMNPGIDAAYARRGVVP